MNACTVLSSLIAISGLMLSVGADATLGNIIISKGYINKLCSESCRQSTDKALIENCERGCRFFDYAQTSNLATNETEFLALCIESCSEAYALGKNRDVCVSGCNKAKQEIDNIVQMSNHLLQEADKQVNFLNSIFDMMSSTFWSSEESEENDFDDAFKNNQLIDTILGNGKTNKLDKSLDGSDVEVITMLGNEMAAKEGSFCATRRWLHRLSFILIIMGTMSLLFISVFYLLAIIKHKKARNAELSIDAQMVTPPPSYETLVKDGYIVIAKNDIMIAPVHDEKKEKLVDA